MKCTKEKNIRGIKNKNKKEKRWTIAIPNIINNNKFIMTIVALFITLSLFNIIMIINFVTLLERNI